MTSNGSTLAQEQSKEHKNSFLTQSKNPTEAEENNFHYVEETFKTGSKYYGYKANGKRHGQGKFYYKEGSVYDGEWKDDRMNGYGKLFYASGRLAYEGFWENDKFSGRGTAYN